VEEAERLADPAQNVSTLVWFNYRRVPAITLAKEISGQGNIGSNDDRAFLVQRSTQYVYQVDDYGRRGKFLNTLDALIEQYTMANERQKQAETETTS
jgi:hypothetical protein